MPSTHPSRTDYGTMKISQTATGLIFERYPPDAAEMVKSGAFTYVAAATASIRDTLQTKTRAQLVAAAVSAGRVNNHPNEPLPDLIDWLIRPIELGTIALP
jgi:hypothetical protein